MAQSLREERDLSFFGKQNVMALLLSENAGHTLNSWS